MPVTVNASVFVKEIAPLVELVALKLVTVSPVKAVPVDELVVKTPAPVVLIVPDVCVILAAVDVKLMPPVLEVILPPIDSVPLDCKVIKPVPVVATVPDVVKAPVLLMFVVPLPPSLTLVTVNVEAVLLNAMLPLVVFDALKLETAFAMVVPVSAIPVTADVDNVPAVMLPFAPCETEPAVVSNNCVAAVPELTALFTVMPADPLSVTALLLVVMPATPSTVPTVRADELVNCRAPVVDAFDRLAAKFVTALANVKVTLPAEPAAVS